MRWEMNRKVFQIAASLAALLAVCGCESDRNKTPGVFPEGGRRNIVSESAPTTEAGILRRAAAEPVKPVAGGGWKPLFDGKTLKGWKEAGFAAGGEVICTNGMILCQRGDPFSGLKCTNEIPRVNYEISLEAMRVSGWDFFCGLTFPVNESQCSLIVGGWGGSVVGLSSLDGSDASENETTKFISFESGQWYQIRLRVTSRKIEAWVEQKKVVDVVTVGRKISLRAGDIDRCVPLGLSCWTTSAAYRAIQIRPVDAPADPRDPNEP